MIIDGKWELRERLGKGTFGEVYEAWHLKLDHPAAIKILRGEYKDAKQRFLEEAQIMAPMTSEHLVRALDYGELPDGSPYFVMDMVRGKSLRHWLSRERLPMWRAVAIGAEMVEGLVEAHKRGVVHGDIKPENVVIGEDDDKARLLDFGLAQTTATEGEDIGGTPHYMAPEMLFDEAPTSVRTDVYAVGVVLYEMLTGRLPRGHLDMKGFAKIKAAWESKPNANPVLMYCKDVPEAQREALEMLDALVMEALAYEPTQRPKSAVPMLEELRKLRERLSPYALSSMLTAENGAVKVSMEVKTTAPFKTVEQPRAAPWRRVIGAMGVVVVSGLLGLGPLPWLGENARVTKEPKFEEPRGLTIVAKEIEDPFGVEEIQAARGGILVTVPENANDAVMKGYGALCNVLDGDRPRTEGMLPVHCCRVPSMGADALMALAEKAQVRVVVLVGDGDAEALEMRSTKHHRGNALLARLDGLPLPKDPKAMALVGPVLEAVVGANTPSGATGAAEAEIPAFEWKDVGARWGTLAEWLRVQQGHRSPEDLNRREELARVLDRMLTEDRERGEDRGVAAYHELAMLVWANSRTCDDAEPLLRKLSSAEHRLEIRLAVLLDRAACLLKGSDPVARVDEAEALLAEAFEASGDDPCVRVAAIGTISWIDRWKGGAARWEEHAERLPPPSRCEPAMWSREYSVRGDALVDDGRPCEAAQAYALAYGALRTNVIALVAWSEYAWRCEPGLEVPRQPANDALREALESQVFERPEQRVSIAYMRWWLTREPADALRVLDEHAKVRDGEPAMLEGTASDLEAEICAEVKGEACSLRILARPKRAGDAERLRSDLGLR
ncbi:serine/threonine-protein kinase [Paraliomyxa miuraensis]|uniref:serine/threonine-protein kinase n=1 Tax=Paraliomyxa miuraensis TaxID=376150 RepID=UPI00224F444D|nr:serine/threonine-protein kinase [Paraliomyxa miuraensis]